MTLLYSIPSILLLAIAIVVVVAGACGGQIYIHRHFRSADFVQHNEVGGFIISVVGTLYAVMLGFLTVVVWQQFADARQSVALESAAAADAWHTSVGLPAMARTKIRKDILDYADDMVDREWAEMRSGEFDKQADVFVMDAFAIAGGLIPVNQGEANAQAATVQQLSVLHDYRQRRLASNRSGLPWFEWLVLFIGAVCVICFCWLFGVENKRTHLLMTAVVTTLIVSMLVLLFELQYPFRSDIGIGPEIWTGTLEHIKFMQMGGQMQMKM